MAHMSQRFCLRWNNHQANLLSVFDQLLHDESFVDVTLAVDGQYLRAHKMVLSACSPYFQALFVSHPENHPIVILNDVPFADMRCLLDFMYRGEVSVDQDRLTAFLKVAESLRIKGLTEVNEEKCDLPSIASSLLSGSEGGSSGGDGSGATHHQNQHVQSHHHHQQHHHKNQHQHHHHYQQQQQMQQLTQPNLSGSQPPPPPSLHRIQLSQPLSTSSLSLSPSLVGAGASNNSRSSNNNNNNSNNNNNAATKLHIPSPSSGNNTSVNQYFSSLSTLNQRRKRGRPRKLSGSSDTPSTASPEHDMNTDYDSRASDYGHAPPDLLEVDMRESQHSPICDEQILASPNRGKSMSRDVSTDDCSYIKSEPSDDIAAANTTSSFQESDSSPRLKEGSVSRPQSRTSANHQSDRYPPEPEISICLEDNENDDDNNYDYDNDIEEEEDDEEDEDDEDDDGEVDEDDVRIHKKKKTSNGDEVFGDGKFTFVALASSNDPTVNKRGSRSRQNNFSRRGRLFGSGANFTTFMTTGRSSDSGHGSSNATAAAMRLYRFSSDSKDKLPQQYYQHPYVVDYLEGAENEKMDDDQNKEEPDQEDDNNNEDEYNECMAIANVPAASDSLSSKNSRPYVVINNTGDDSNSSHLTKSGVNNAGNAISGGSSGSTKANVSATNIAANGDSSGSGVGKQQQQQPSKPLDKSSVRRYCVQVAEHLFQCTLCFKTYTHISNFSRHFLSAHHGIRQEIPCPVCFRIFTRRDNMLTHMKQVHRITVTRGLATSLIQKLSTGGGNGGGTAGSESTTASGAATVTASTTNSSSASTR